MAIPFTFNIAKGRDVELYLRVFNSDPATSGLILIPCAADDTEANAQDAATVTAALATAIDEQTTGSWVRKTLTAAQLVTASPDNSANTYPVGVPSVTWTAPTTNTTGLLVAYAPDVAGADTTLIPLTYHAFAITGNGSDVVLDPSAFFQGV